jgi:uncharacterized membrane protein (DUF373 family)
MPERTPESNIFPWLARAGQMAYIAVGISFLIVAILTLVFAWINFLSGLGKGNVLPAVVSLINDILLILIILEVLETILSYLQNHIILLEPFLYIGIIAAIRRILASGAYLSILEGSVNKDLFYAYLWDIGMNTMVIVALVFSVYLFSRRGKTT